MPQLDFTYFATQISSLIITFTLIYFTASRSFFFRFNQLTNRRKKLVEHYIKNMEKKMSKAQEIEQQIEYSKKQASSKIDEEIKKIKKHLCIIRTKKLADLEQEIYRKNMLHKMLLNEIEKKVTQDLYTDSNKIKETISNYLFDKI